MALICTPIGSIVCEDPIQAGPDGVNRPSAFRAHLTGSRSEIELSQYMRARLTRHSFMLLDPI
jgi:hypothetical protein